MADPICRWRNPYLSTVVELINLLPKEELPQQRARELVNQISPYDFYRTPYQLACQLGLYHETNGRYFPKFTYTPTEDELIRYLQNWITHYCIPNPYTRGFDDLEPFSIHSEICKILIENQAPTNWETIRERIFGDNIGNNDILVNSINSYSPVVSIDNGMVILKAEKTYADLIPFLNVDISTDRNNKEYFFDLFPLSLSTTDNLLQINQNLIQEVNSQDIELVKEIQNLPNLTETEKNQIVAARIGQGFFRRNLILECGFCPITLVDETRLLVASHIKPWRVSNNIERINPKNGILLTPTFDKLFDNGFLSFTNDKRTILSPTLSDITFTRLGISDNLHLPHLPIAGREDFLEYHRTVILKR
jgi:hypothetical protein